MKILVLERGESVIKNTGFASLEWTVSHDEGSGGEKGRKGRAGLSECAWGEIWGNSCELNVSPSVMGEITSSLRAVGMELQAPREAAGL